MPQPCCRLNSPDTEEHLSIISTFVIKKWSSSAVSCSFCYLGCPSWMLGSRVCRHWWDDRWSDIGYRNRLGSQCSDTGRGPCQRSLWPHCDTEGSAADSPPSVRTCGPAKHEKHGKAELEALWRRHQDWPVPSQTIRLKAGIAQSIVCWARCLAWYRGDFSLGVSMGSDSIP